MLSYASHEPCSFDIGSKPCLRSLLAYSIYCHGALTNRSNGRFDSTSSCLTWIRLWRSLPYQNFQEYRVWRMMSEIIDNSLPIIIRVTARLASYVDILVL